MFKSEVFDTTCVSSSCVVNSNNQLAVSITVPAGYEIVSSSTYNTRPDCIVSGEPNFNSNYNAGTRIVQVPYNARAQVQFTIIVKLLLMKTS